MPFPRTQKQWLFLGGFCALLAACSGGVGTPEAQPFDPEPVAYSDPSEPTVRVGVLAIRSAVAASAQYGPIIEYLEEQLGESVALVPLTQEEQFEQVADGNLDFVFSNPLAAVQLRRLYDTEFIATLSRRETGASFGGLIIARADSGITELTDIVGTDVTCVAFQTAAAGCNFQVMHLEEAGISSDQFASFTETPSQDNIVLGVLNGSVDVGFIRTGQLEKMLAEGTLLSLDELTVVDEAEDGFARRHTTELYPEWPFAALQATDAELIERVRSALLTIPEDHPALDNVKGEGFIEAADYGQLDELIEQLQLRSWEAT